VSILLVTGTDTGVGKTLVTAAIAAALAARGTRIGVAKPAETGCRLRGGVLYPEDAATLAAAAGSPEPLELVCPYRFADPLAPALAAERAGSTIDLDALVTALRQRAAALDLLLVEGAGGLLVPLTRSATYADLATALAAQVLLVVGSRLGAINHALLTLAALETRALPIRGYVLNRLNDDADLATETNGPLLRALTPVPCLGELPWLADAGALLSALRGEGDAGTRAGTGASATARTCEQAGAAARARLAALASTCLDLDAIVGRG
jgi:dethiobiotin synthetase